MKRTSPLLAVFAFALAACNANSPVQTDHHAHGVTLSNASQATSAQTLQALRQLTAPLHDLDSATARKYALFKNDLTAPDGCVSDASQGGMGYHYTRGTNIVGDDSIALLDPEFVVYAPENGPSKGGEVKRRLAGFDYFIPFSPKWPAPTDPSFIRKPRLSDFSTMRGLPDTEFAASRFGGWMFHIWLWEHNPGGMFANWNTSVPLCNGSPV